ncbi:hypothetical protein [Pseudomonas putida]|uniref:Uncharacterized protein n=1 Tax=Pseudomonas putida TaxID=303 RepID=A0A2C5W1E1_PSEPU|nr:hypothetical protein [Pseudomonas putida]PHH38736.1 hypothetical protein CRX57_00615 [Pseudomonas putida]
MPWLRGGTVAVTNGSTTVIGTNADFAANSRIGDAFIGPDGVNYEIGNVASATVISIIPAYKGPTASGVAYAIMPVQGYPKALADSFNSINRQWGSKLEALGTTGNYDILPLAKGGTGAAANSGAEVFAALGAGGILGEAPYFGGNIDSRTAVPLDVCFIGPSTGGTKPSGVSYGILTTKGAIGNQGSHQELWEVTGATGATTNTWHRDQYGNGGAWGPWRRRYSNNNILGTVAQTSGAPTGAIIERGSNASGEYVRYADGTQICWKRIGTSSVNAASGALFLSNAVGSGSYPMAFISIPTVSAMACVSGYQWALWAMNASEPTATAWGSYYAAAAASTLQGALINIIAVGRWF